MWDSIVLVFIVLVPDHCLSFLLHTAQMLRLVLAFGVRIYRLIIFGL